MFSLTSAGNTYLDADDCTRKLGAWDQVISVIVQPVFITTEPKNKLVTSLARDLERNNVLCYKNHNNEVDFGALPMTPKIKTTFRSFNDESNDEPAIIVPYKKPNGSLWHSMMNETQILTKEVNSSKSY